MQLLCQALQVTQPPCWDCLHCWAACKQGIPAALKHLYKLSAVLTHDSCVLQVEWRGEILQLSWSPRAYHLKGFLSDEECEHIKKIVSNSSNSSQHILLAMFLLHAPVTACRQQLLVGTAVLHAPAQTDSATAQQQLGPAACCQQQLEQTIYTMVWCVSCSLLAVPGPADSK